MNDSLVLTHCEPGQHPFPVLDDKNEVVGGPSFKTVRRGGLLRFLHTPAGRFELGPVLAAAGAWRPELVIVHADCTQRCLPINLRALGATRVLLIGGATHILAAPLRSLIAYALEEKFYHVVLWNRHHVHFFHEAGVRNVHWLPGDLFWIPPFPRAEVRRPQIGFFGSLGKFHPQRTPLLEAFGTAGLPLVAGSRARREGLRMLSESLVGLNQSLNGELNLRVLETMEAGAMLLTDRLRPQLGLEELFAPGRDYLDYSTIDEALDRARWALAHPEEAMAIAANGQTRCRELFSRDARRRQLIDVLTFGDRGGLFGLDREPRCRRPVVTMDRIVAFQERIMAYEFIQELHRVQPLVPIIGNARDHRELAEDVSDLPRVRWIERTPKLISQPPVDSVGVFAPGESGLAQWTGRYFLCPRLGKEVDVIGWKRISPEVALYVREGDPVLSPKPSAG